MTGNHTVYARFKPNTDTVYLIRHYKLSPDGSTEICYKETRHTGTTGTRTKDATRIEVPGYNYVSGYNKNGKTEVLNGIIDGGGQLVLKLYYEPNQDELFYQANASDVIGITANTKGVTDQKVVVSESAFIRNGYI